MPALVAGIHVFLPSSRQPKTWMAGTSPAMTVEGGSVHPARSVISAHVQARSDHGKTAFRPAQRRVFRRLRQAGICGPRVGDTLGGDRRSRNISPFRAAENPVAAARGGAAAGSGHTGVARGGSDGAGDPARFRRCPGAGQPLLRLERGGTAGASAGAAVAPSPAHPPARTGPQIGCESRGNPVVGRGRGTAGRAGAARSSSSPTDRKSTRLNSRHQIISYAVFSFKKKKKTQRYIQQLVAYTAVCSPSSYTYNT